MNLGVYIQVPFCRTKCTYCNFHTGVFPQGMYSPYVDAVVREIAEHRALYEAAGVAKSFATRNAAANGAKNITSGAAARDGGFVVDTVYIGGGTPSLLEPSALARVMDAVRKSFACAIEEVTLEADPETITREKVAAWRAEGINRASMGTQSFNDKELSAAGRLHRRTDIFAADEALRAGGIGNISFDLIAGLPHQTSESWRESVRELIALGPEHVSIYMLEIDEGSRLGREALAGGARYSAAAIPEDDAIADFYEHGCEALAAAGYEHYEISNWARPGLRSRHNLKYWKREPYLGFGAGAHSFDGAMRWANAHDPAEYTTALTGGRLPAEQAESLSPRQSLDEELFLGLRVSDGIRVDELEARYNVRLEARLGGLFERGLIERNDGRVRLTPSRIAVSNEVFVELVS
ncbi:MAG: radical SAM family heme chaperone HemW [Candidatus Acidiferrales bacterium]